MTKVFKALFCLALCGMAGSVYGEEQLVADDLAAKIMPCIYPPPPGCGAPRLQKLYITSDRVIITDQYILYVDYNGHVQSTPGVFADNGGLYVFALENNFICPMSGASN